MKLRLTDNDKKLMCWMVKNPNLPLKELAEFAEISYWNAYKIKDKLIKSGIIREVIIPNYGKLGFELFIAGFGKLTKSRMESLKYLPQDVEYKEGEFASGIFYGFAESYKGFVLGVAKNYTEIIKNMLSTKHLIRFMRNLRSEHTDIIILPISLTNFYRFFDYGDLLCKEFGVNAKFIKGEEKKNGDDGIRIDEIRALYEMIKNPQIKASALAKIMNVSKQKAAALMHRVLENKLGFRKIIPDMRKIGYEVLVFASWEFDVERLREVGLENIELQAKNVDISNLIFLAFNELRGVALAPFKTLKESRDIISLFSSFVEKMGLLRAEPDYLFLSLEEGIYVKNNDHAPLIQALLKELESH